MPFRKLIHAAGILFLIVFLELEEINPLPVAARIFILWVLIAVLSVILLIEALRLKNPGLLPEFVPAISGLFKTNEQNRLSGAFWYYLAATGLFAFVPLPGLILAMICLTLADPAAALAGFWFRSGALHEGKTIAGSSTYFTTSVFATALISAGYQVSLSVSGLLLGSVFATLAERYLDRLPDDNLTAPVAAVAGYEAGLRISGLMI